MTAALPPPERLDTRPLTAPMSRAAVRAAVARIRARGSGGSAFPGLVPAVIFGLVFGVFFVIVIADSIGSGDGAGPGGAMVFLAAPLVVGATVAAVGIRSAVIQRQRWARLDAFASANDLAFVPTQSDPTEPGLIFSVGSSRVATDAVIGSDVVVANYRYTTGSGRNRATHRWAYLALRLATPLPNIVLDATSNNGLFGASNLPTRFEKGQRLALEGDFDRHFALYCPAGYQADALYLFTPDIMARFVDEAAQLDVEIVDDRLYLYAQRDLSTLDPATWEWLASIVAALESKFAQLARWRDDRLAAPGPSTAPATAIAPPTNAAATAGIAASASAPPTPPALLRPPPGVAPQGRRLRRGASWGGTVVVVVAFAIWAVFVVLR